MSIGLVRGWTRHLTPPIAGWQRTDPLDRRLIGEWRFDPSTGLILLDYTGYKHNGVLTNGPIWTSTEVGRVLSFDGDDDFVEFGTIPTGDVLQLDGDYISIEAYFYPISGGDGFQRIIDKSDGGNAANGWSLFHHSTGGVDRIELAVDGGVKINSNNGTVPADRWTHIIVTGTGVINEGIAYLDGRSVGLQANHAYDIPDVATGMRIGSWNHATGREFEGFIALIRVYDRVLSAAEVRARYELCRKRSQPLVYPWMQPFGGITEIPRIPRPPAAYNILAIY